MANETEADAEPTRRLVAHRPPLDVRIEDPGQKLGLDPHAIVPDLDHQTAPRSIDDLAELDAARPRGVLRGVGEEVDQDLGQACGVGVEQQLSIGDAHHELLLSLIELGARRLDRGVDEIADCDGLSPELQPAEPES
jgi:hypothetical protein